MIYKKITIFDYIIMCETKGVFPFKNVADEPEEIVNTEFQNGLAFFIKNNYYSYRLLSRFQYFLNEDDVIDMIRNICDNVYYINKYTYKKLYDTMKVEYNPIENYSMKEIENVTNSGNDIKNNIVNPYTINQKNGNRIDTNTQSSHTDNENIGEKKQQDNFGQVQTTSTKLEGKAPFESQSYHNLNKTEDINIEQERTDTHTVSALKKFYGVWFYNSNSGHRRAK